MTTITLQTPLTGTAVGTAAEALAFATARGAKRPEFTASLIAAIYTLAPKANLRADVVAARSALETGDWTADLYVTYGNPGGLAKFPDGTYAGGTFTSPVIAAKAMLAHFVAYVYGKSINADTAEWAQYDPRWQAAVDRVAQLGTISTVGEFGNGNWATSDTDAADLVSRFNGIFTASHPSEGVPDVSITDSEGVVLNMTPGLIPEAGFVDRLVPDANNSAWDQLGQRVVRGVTLHRMLGGLKGTDSYFHSGAPGLTDMGADSASDLVYRWNDETGAAHPGVSANRAPWASGPLRATAYGDGLKFAQKYGANAVNRDRRSLEIDRFYGDAWSEASMREYAQTTAHDAHDYGITWEQFPYSPKDDCSFVCWHNEFCGTDYKECPGSVVMAQTDDFIAIVKGIMKAAQQQTGDVPKPIPVPVSPYPKGASEEWVREVYGKLSVSWASKPFTFDINRAECRAWLAYCTSYIPNGGDYEQGHWGPIEKVIRRGNKGDKGRDFLYGNGFVYHQEPADRQSDAKADAA